MNEPPAPPSPPFLPIRSEEDFERFIGEFTNYERMKTFRYSGDTWNLERMAGLARDLGDPQSAFRSVHIAGTKGKGSTSLMLESLLAASGYSVGTYTSPHIESLRERIRTGGSSIRGRDLCALASSVLPVLDERHRGGPDRFPTFFELMTVLAMIEFRNRQVDWGIFEVGLGGRLDATNILLPRSTAITSIGIEHTEQLGNTLESIAAEKAGIIKPRTPVVIGRLPGEAERVIRAVAEERRAPVTVAEPSLVRPGAPGTIEVGGPPLGWSCGPIPAGVVRGDALRRDLSLAIHLWTMALREDGRGPTEDHLLSALGRLLLPARIEIFSGTPPLVVDGAHTRESVRALREALDELSFPRPRVCIFALAADKPARPILAELRELTKEVFFTRADPSRGRDPAELAREFLELSGTEPVAIEDPREAFQAAMDRGRPLVISGSFYLAGKLRPIVVRRAESEA